MNQVVEKANGPALTLIYRGSMIIAVLVFGWFATEFLTHKDEHSASEKELAIALTKLTTAVDSLKDGTADRYTSVDAKADQERVNQRITTMAENFNSSVADLKQRVRDIERAR